MKRLLLVDDKDVNLYFLQALLSAHGYVIDTARHGAEALTKARQTPPDLVISDLLMPVMDGYTLLRHWRTDDVLEQIPFIVYTATYTEDADEKLAYSFGADAFLRKPAEPEEILACVEQQLDRARTLPAPPGAADSGSEGELLKLYSERLVRKLEKKTLELEFANQSLLRELDERRRNEAKQRSQAILLDNAQRIGRMGSWSFDVGSRRLTWSDATCELFGITPAEFGGTLDDFLRLVLEQDRAGLIAAQQAALPSSPLLETEYRIRRADGQVRWMYERGMAEYDADGNSLRRLGMVMDITERRAAEDALRTSEERFRLLSNATSDAIWDWTPHDGYRWRSEGVEAITGFRAEALPPDRAAWELRVHPDDLDTLNAEVARVLAGERNDWSAAYRFRRRDDSYARVLDRGHAIRDSMGTVVRMVGGVSDVSDRHELEGQLRQSQRLEAIGQLTGGVAHDFNNLLTVILGNAELLAESLHDSAQRPLLDMISAAALSGSELTHRLLAFARKQALDPRAADIHALVRDMQPLLRRLLGEQVEIHTRLGSGPGVVFVDAPQLESALLNLCINARDAMPHGGRLILETANVVLDDDYVAQHTDLQAGDYMMLAVSDSGIGIPREHLRRVFEPFFTTKEKGKGTGLGMAMVYGFIKQSGGHVSLYSEQGVGTTVKLYLPASSEAAAVTTAGEPQPPLQGGSEHVLLVEDDELVRRFASGQLMALGYQVVQADHGAAALQILRSEQPVDLLFTDVVMPGISGSELAEQARQLRPGLRVLFTSGYTRDAIVHHGRLDPGVRLLNKPYRRVELARQVRDALEGEGGDIA